MTDDRVTPADVPTPDAIRPEWEPWVEKATRATRAMLALREAPALAGTPTDEEVARAAAEAVLAAVCGDIVEAARRDALGELRCDDRAPTLLPDVPPSFCARPRDHGGWHEMDTVDGLPPMRWISNSDSRSQEPPQSDQDAVSRIPGSAERSQGISGPRGNLLAHRRDGGHWLTFDDGKVVGCHCGYDADEDSDSGWGDSVLDHFEAVVRGEEAAERDRLLALVAAQAEQIAELRGSRLGVCLMSADFDAAKCLHRDGAE